ncbi:hypothetical protein Trydic_g1765 [Trypoxylus dichotomus]
MVSGQWRDISLDIKDFCVLKDGHGGRVNLAFNSFQGKDTASFSADVFGECKDIKLSDAMNRCSMRSLKDLTPYLGKPPNVSHFRQFCLNLDRAKGKFDSIGNEWKFLGYSEQRNGFGVYLLNEREGKTTQGMRIIPPNHEATFAEEKKQTLLAKIPLKLALNAPDTEIYNATMDEIGNKK